MIKVPQCFGNSRVDDSKIWCTDRIGVFDSSTDTVRSKMQHQRKANGNRNNAKNEHLLVFVMKSCFYDIKMMFLHDLREK